MVTEHLIIESSNKHVKVFQISYLVDRCLAQKYRRDMLRYIQRVI